MEETKVVPEVKTEETTATLPISTPPPEDDISTLESFDEEISIPQHRALFDPKYKTYGGVAKSLKEGERYKGQLETEKNKLIEQIEQYESQILDLQDKFEKQTAQGTTQAGNGKDQQLALVKQEYEKRVSEQGLFEANLWLQSLIEKSKANQTAEETAVTKKKETQEKQKTEFIGTEKKCIDKYGQVKWDEIKKELVPIMQERPYIGSLRELVAIWKDLQEEKEEQIKTEQETGEIKKRSARVETGSGTPPLPANVMAEIEGATSSQELQKIGQRLKGKKL